MREINIEPHKGRLNISIGELWRYRDLMYLLAKRDITLRYRQTALGVIWAVLQPLLTMLVFTLIFGRLAKMPSDDIPYSVFAFAGLLPWLFFAAALNSAGNSVVNARNLVTKVYFPRLVIPISSVGAPLVDMLVSTIFMVALMSYHGLPISASIVWLPALVLLAALAAIGIGTLVAALAVSYRDFRHVLPPLTTIGMFATPVIYPPTLIPEAWRWLLFLNPMSGVVDGMRSAWFGREFNLTAISFSLGITIVFLFVGITYFRSVERRFADIV